ncbi:MAG: hemolysin family protein [Bryobacterales bacterium]|nr:hemolysin family protein [Bryobacterales bacterium]
MPRPFAPIFMDANYGYRFSFLFFLVAVNAFFAAAEVALLSVRRSRLKEMADEGNVGAIAALSLLSNTERLLSVVQVGVTLASLGIGWAGEETIFASLMALAGPLVTPATQWALRGVALAFTFSLMTFVTVVIGEVVPKNVAIENSARFATLVAPVLLVFYRVVEPFVWLIETSSTRLSRLLGVRSDAGGGAHSIEELKSITSAGKASEQYGDFEERVIHQTLDLQDLSAREIMVPWNDVVSLPVEAKLGEVLDCVMTSQYSRIPVYEDDPRNIIGILHFKDLLRVWDSRRAANRVKRPTPPFKLRHLLRRHLVAPESKPVDELLEEFLEGRVQMAMVVDEFGLIVGLVTVEDALEQIVGEIQDEHDLRVARPKLKSPSFTVEGTVPIRDLANQYGIELPTDAGFETLAGFLLDRFEDIPKESDVTEYEDLRFTILEMDRNRIAKVLIERLTLAEIAEDEAESEDEEQ